jgi:Asp-tRNA(Asn)/Glu-tRNA(Gln) amidotransferase A subunit family amidase
LPQVTLPLSGPDGLPRGLGLIAPRGRDRDLLAFVARYAAAYLS